MAHHIRYDTEAALGVFEIPVLYASLDDIQRSRHNEGCAGSGDGCHKVLHPRRGVVVGELVEIFLGRR